MPETMPQPPRETSPAVQPGALAPAVRAALVVVGTVALVLGVIGIVLPVLPTTPFLLVTAACYARASRRLYEWLLGQPSLGPIVAHWRRSRQLPPGVKARALVAVAVTFSLSILLVGEPFVALVLLVIGVLVAIFLWRIPTARPDPERDGSGQ